MAHELEVKVLNIEPKEMEKRLISVGAVKVKEERQENIIFDTRRHLEKRGIEGYLRIRKTTDLKSGKVSTAVTLKKRKFSKNLRENIEVESIIQDGEALLSIFEALGLNVVHKGYKLRTSYAYEDLLFEIDIWDKDTYPEPYMEIELKREEDLQKAIQLLQLEEKDITNKSLGILRRKYFLLDDKRRPQNAKRNYRRKNNKNRRKSSHR